MHLGPLFVQMALLYPWATKEYLLWDMSLGQMYMYLALGIEQKYGKQDGGKTSLKEKSYDELKALREDMVANGLIDKRDDMRERYGDIDG